MLDKTNDDSERLEKCSFAKVTDQDSNEFTIQEVHFHTPSEHTINGQSHPIEIQLVG